MSAGPGTREDDGPVLRFGFTYEHVQALARSAVRSHARSAGMDPSDRFEAAHFAVVEDLYTAQEPVTSLDLFLAGVRGLNKLRQGDLRERGYASRGTVSRDPAAGPWSARSAWRYWHQPLPTGPEEKATDRVALGQVMATLTRSQALALLAPARGRHRRPDGGHRPSGAGRTAAGRLRELAPALSRGRARPRMAPDVARKGPGVPSIRNRRPDSAAPHREAGPPRTRGGCHHHH